MDTFIIYKNENIVYATLAEDEEDACKRLKSYRTKEEWEEIIKNKSQYKVVMLDGDTYPLKE